MCGSRPGGAKGGPIGGMMELLDKVPPGDPNRSPLALPRTPEADAFRTTKLFDAAGYPLAQIGLIAAGKAQEPMAAPAQAPMTPYSPGPYGPETTVATASPTAPAAIPAAASTDLAAPRLRVGRRRAMFTRPSSGLNIPAA
jgi:hypothetical protein